MILSFRHKGLKIFFETGSTKGIQAKHAAKLRLILAALDAAALDIESLNIGGAMLHMLEPKSANMYSIRVSGNWRITFRLAESGVEIVDYLDYH